MAAEESKYPGMDVSSSENEKVIRGSKEGFIDTLDTNIGLIKRRIKSEKLTIKYGQCGEMTRTKYAIVYVEGLARESVIKDIEKRLEKINTKGVMDSGIIEQIIEEEKTIFPKFQTCERPDMASMSLLSGRVVLVVDNTPVSLIMPTTINSLFKTADDYYNNHLVSTMARIIRYIAAFFAIGLPALYLAVVTFHPEILPTALVKAFVDARKEVPFPAVVEVLIMEFAFELLREAGIRIPGPMGSTIGTVGGLIIGQAAVTANIVSPIIVIVVAITALSSFAITNEELSSAFRILKYIMIILAYFLGFFGIIAGFLVILCHMAGMKTFGFPYLMPYVSDEINDDIDKKDGVYKTENLEKKTIFESRE